MSIIEITSYDHFETILADSGPNKHNKKHIIVDFYGSECPPCKRFAPVYNELSLKYADSDILFTKVNIEKVRDLAIEYNISCIPTFKFFCVGKDVELSETIEGINYALEGIENVIHHWLSANKTTNVVEIESYDHFETILTDNGPTKHNKQHIIVDFYGTNCPPCRQFAPIYDELSLNYEYADVLFTKVNVSKVKDLAIEYNISNIPAFKFFNIGQDVELSGTIVGAGKALEGIENMIKSWTVKPTLVEDF